MSLTGTNGFFYFDASDTDLCLISALQCPTWGYPTEGAYYRDAASTDSLMSIRIPFLSVQAEDDPVSKRPSYGLYITNNRRLLAAKLYPSRR